MALELNGTTGVSLVQDGVVTAADLASGAARSNFGAGAVLQVVQGTTTSQVVIAGADNWTSTGLTASITPSSASSKVLVLVSTCGDISGPTNRHVGGFRLKRGSTVVCGYGTNTFGVENGATTSLRGYVSMNFLDSPSTTSSTTYTVEAAPEGSGSYSLTTPMTGSTAQIVLMEIAA